MQPAVILIDELTSAFAPERGSEVFEVMEQHAVANMTMCVVTDKVGCVRAVADQVIGNEIVCEVRRETFACATHKRG